MFNKVCIYIGLRKSLSMLKIKPVSYLMHAFFKVFNKSTTLLKRVAHNLLLASCPLTDSSYFFSKRPFSVIQKMSNQKVMVHMPVCSECKVK